jgi:hypothetical protein
MNKFVKSVLALGITSALNISLISNVNAATYELVDKEAATKLKYTYAQQQNEAGDMAISGTSLYNFPVQYDYLDEDDFLAIEFYAFNRFLGVHGLNFIEDSDALRAGDPTANDLAWVIRWLQDTSSGVGLNIEYQKVGDTIAMTNAGGVSTDYNLFDETFKAKDTGEETGVLTRSTIDIVSGITDGGVSYGTATAPYLPDGPYLDSDDIEHTYWFREHGMRGFVSDNFGAEVEEIVPFETEYVGGFSAVLDVNETAGSGFVAGFSSYKVTQAFADFIENEEGGCADPDILAEMPLEACIARAQLQASYDIYHTMALRATLAPNAAPVPEALGLLITPHEDDERPFSSHALAVNTLGVAVGFADGFYEKDVINPDVDERSFFHYAVVYKDGEVIDLADHASDEGSSRAYDINDAGIAVGHIAKSINGGPVNKFFYVDTNVSEEEVEMIIPQDFFSGSDSTARAINNSGLIVGEGEIETHNESTLNPRRTAAFVYDMNNDIFLNLNDLIPCAKRLSYDIIEARGITEGGMISATAIVKADRTDAKGEIMRDEAGEPLREDVVRAISLNPIPDDGEVCTAEEEGKVIRQGASVSIMTSLFMIAILGFRRKFF